MTFRWRPVSLQLMRFSTALGCHRGTRVEGILRFDSGYPVQCFISLSSLLTSKLGLGCLGTKHRNKSLLEEPIGTLETSNTHLLKASPRTNKVTLDIIIMYTFKKMNGAVV